MVTRLCDTAAMVQTKVKGAYYAFDDDQATYLTDVGRVKDLEHFGHMEPVSFESLLKLFRTPCHDKHGLYH